MRGLVPLVRIVIIRKSECPDHFDILWIFFRLREQVAGDADPRVAHHED